MGVLRTLGRGMIAALFLIAGVDVLRRPEPRAEVAHDALENCGRLLPPFPTTSPPCAPTRPSNWSLQRC